MKNKTEQLTEPYIVYGRDEMMSMYNTNDYYSVTLTFLKEVWDDDGLIEVSLKRKKDRKILNKSIKSILKRLDRNEIVSKNDEFNVLGFLGLMEQYSNFDISELTDMEKLIMIINRQLFSFLTFKQYPYLEYYSFTNGNF